MAVLSNQINCGLFNVHGRREGQKYLVASSNLKDPDNYTFPTYLFS